MSTPSPPGAPAAPAPADARRGFLKILTGALTAGVGAVAAIPGLAFLAHPLRRATVSGGGEPVRVAVPSDVRPGQPLRVDVVGQQRDAWLRIDKVKLGACWLVRSDDGRVRALSTICPHLGCGIDWNQSARRFDCPCHGSQFDPAGKRVAGPSPRDMDEVDVLATEADIKVRFRRFRVSSRKKEPIG